MTAASIAKPKIQENQWSTGGGAERFGPLGAARTLLGSVASSMSKRWFNASCRMCVQTLNVRSEAAGDETDVLAAGDQTDVLAAAPPRLGDERPAAMERDR
jgi:hypothetical protein